jgi:hypothetical protein
LFKASTSRPCHCLVLAVAIAHRPIYISPLTLCTCPIRPALSTRGGWKIICISLCLLFCLFFCAPAPSILSCPVPFPRFLSHSLCLFLSLSLSVSPCARSPPAHSYPRASRAHQNKSLFPSYPRPHPFTRPPSRAHAHLFPFFASAVGASKRFLYAIAIYPFIYFVFL